MIERSEIQVERLVSLLPKHIRAMSMLFYLGGKRYGHGKWRLPGGIGFLGRGTTVKQYKRVWWRIYLAN